MANLPEPFEDDRPKPSADWTTPPSEESDSDNKRYDLTLKSKARVPLHHRRSHSTIRQSESDNARPEEDDSKDDYSKDAVRNSDAKLPLEIATPADTQIDGLSEIPLATPGETVPDLQNVADSQQAPALAAGPSNGSAAKSNMIVETETVPAVATVAVTTAGNLNSASSLKIKKSTDNVTRTTANRKKKKTRPAALNSKAEIFAAKIASAVDEVHSSDSDETFVYESNPPESQRPKWSRNPSASSLPIDPYQTLNGTRRSKLPPGRDEERAPESSELEHSNRERAVLQAPTPSPVGVPESDPIPGNLSLSKRSYQVQKVRSNSRPPSPRHSSNHRSPKVGTAAAIQGQVLKGSSSRLFDTSNKDNVKRWRRYLDEEDEIDADMDGDIDDDDFDLSETTPLRQTVHTIRRSRKNGGVAVYSPHNYRQQDKERLYYIRLLLWLLVAITGILGTGFIMGFVLASAKPLQQVHMSQVFDIVVSDEELAFTFIIEAINPGIFGVSVDQSDLDLFAKSSYLDDEPEDTPWMMSSSLDGEFADLFEPYEPQSPDSDSKARTMLLGNVEHFDVPLIFEGGILSRRPQKSIGDVRLLNPGRNVTGVDDGKDHNTRFGGDYPEDEGQKRWKKLNDHPFDLIVRGVLKYKLFLGGKQTVSVAKTVRVDPA